MIIAWASTENELKFFRIERSLRTSLFVLKMTFKHLPPARRNQATRRQSSCLAVDPGRCEFWRVQKNSARGHRHLHNPPDIFPCNLIKLFTSLAPNYLDPAIHSLSINQPVSLNRIEPTNVTFPFRTTNRCDKQRLVMSDTQRFQTNNNPPPKPCPLCLAFLIVLGFSVLLKNRAHSEKENFYHWKYTILRQ